MWVPPSATQTVRREDLPKSLFPVRTVPLSQHDPEALRNLARRPQRLLPAPTDPNPGRQRRLANLAQYRGRSIEGQERALGNMPRKIKSEPVEIPAMSEATTQPAVPASTPMFVRVEDTLRGKMRRRVLSQDEWDLYIATWNQFLTAHPEYDHPEDLDDLHTICMDTVYMQRIEEFEFRNPGKRKRDDYETSYNRIQVARRNLTARRVDRVGTKANKGGNTFNVAVLAGKLTDEQIRQREVKMVEQRNKEEDFLNNPRRLEDLLPNIAQQDDMIDAEVVNKGTSEQG